MQFFVDRPVFATVIALIISLVGVIAVRQLAVEQYPVEKIQMNGELLVNLSTDYEPDPFAEAFVKGAATRVKQTLNEMDHDKATFFKRQNAVEMVQRSFGCTISAPSRLRIDGSPTGDMHHPSIGCS